ncbi:hypothetical protein [Moorena sp. SIO3H5]|uniref:hypothetical protein n=1 Tax=Moorena sp. SIO3H5 TaxID=2607834 RepID=UPI0013B984D6|nr:hypothetical protein [Moorena sp. SIO3H5]NEO73827.1 hypothetical protein [Moorena sp. SIO3H5]
MSRLPQISNHHRQPYPSDMSDVESEVLRPLIPKLKGFGHLRRVKLRSYHQRYLLCAAPVDPS